MAINILIPTPLRQYVANKDTVQVSGNTAGEVLKDLTAKYAELAKHIMNEDGKLRSFVNIYLNGEDIRFLSKNETPVKDGDTLMIVPAIAGGC